MTNRVEPSKSAVRKAGSRIRKYKRETPSDVTDELFAASIKILEEYRTSFAPGMVSANTSMRSFVNTCGFEAQVTQRLKRMTTIIDKICWREREIKHFLLKYDRKADRLIECIEFTDADEATREHEAAELQVRSGQNLDVVLVGSDSIETVKVTHSNYFDGNVMRLVREALQLS